MTLPRKNAVLGALCSVTDCEHKTAPIQEEGIPLIRTPNIGKGRLILEGVQRISETTYRTWSRRGEPKPGDLIMAREAPVGNVALVASGQKVCLGQRTVLLRRTSDSVDSTYLSYLLNSPAVSGYVNLLSTGATVGHLNVSDIRRLALPALPPPATQKKIAAVLGAYDDLIEANRRRIVLLERMAEELYREWFVRLRFPGHAKTKITKGLPAGWSVRKIGDIVAEVKRGIRQRDLTADQRYIGLEHIPRRSIALREWATADSVDSDKLQFKERDILFSKIRPYLHKVSLAHFGGVCSTDAIVLRPVERVYEGFVLFTVFSETFIELATVASNGTKMPRADWKFLKKLELSVPSPELCGGFQSQFDAQYSQIVTLLRQNEVLTRTRDLLLPRLISGKLAVENLDVAFPPSLAAGG